MITKICAECKHQLELTNFHKNKRRFDGYHEYCKDCRKSQYLRRDQESAIRRSAIRYVTNKEKCLAQMHVRYKKNIEQKQEYGRQNYAANKAKYIANAIFRKNRIKQATPPWFDEFQVFAMQEAYDLVQRRKKATGFAWSIDHIIPLQGKTVSGLHVIDNIAVIPKAMNNAKRAQYLESDNRILFYSRKSK